jgi:hypothetical protein
VAGDIDLRELRKRRGGAAREFPIRLHMVEFWHIGPTYGNSLPFGYALGEDGRFLEHEARGHATRLR